MKNCLSFFPAQDVEKSSTGVFPKQCWEPFSYCPAASSRHTPAGGCLGAQGEEEEEGKVGREGIRTRR